MAAYLAKVKGELFEFEYSTVEHIPHEQSSNADALARLATTKEAVTLNVLLLEFFESLRVTEKMIEGEMLIQGRPG